MTKLRWAVLPNSSVNSTRLSPPIQNKPQKGNLPLQRPRTTSIAVSDLANNRTTINASIIEAQKKLKMLLATTMDIAVEPIAAEMDAYQNRFALVFDSFANTRVA